MATAIFAPTYRLSHLLAPSLLRSPGLYVRLNSDAKPNHVENFKEASNCPKSVPASAAFELIHAGYSFLDVRTPDEYKAGHPTGAMNIPYMFQTTAGMLKNPEFEQQVLSSFKKDDQFIIGCRSGKRSLMATTDLTSLGFKDVFDLAGGYIAWTQNGFPVQKAE